MRPGARVWIDSTIWAGSRGQKGNMEGQRRELLPEKANKY